MSLQIFLIKISCRLRGVPKLLHKTVVVWSDFVIALWSSYAHLLSFLQVVLWILRVHSMHRYMSTQNAHPFSFFTLFPPLGLSWSLEGCFTQWFSVITIKYICWTWDWVLLLWWICNMLYMYFWYLIIFGIIVNYVA